MSVDCKNNGIFSMNVQWDEFIGYWRMGTSKLCRVHAKQLNIDVPMYGVWLD